MYKSRNVEEIDDLELPIVLGEPLSQADLDFLNMEAEALAFLEGRTEVDLSDLDVSTWSDIFFAPVSIVEV